MTSPTSHATELLASDVHCHILPGCDEGARSPAESLMMARELAALGVRRVHATPHQFRFGHERTLADVEARVGAIRHELDRHGIALDVVPSAEYLFGERFFEAVAAREPLITWTFPGRGEDRRHVLIELPLRDPVVGVDALARRLRDADLHPVMAHPERVRSVVDDPARTSAWRAAGWAFQLDLMSLAGTYGRDVRLTADRLLDGALYDFVGSDLHRAVQLDDLARAHERLRRAGVPPRPPPSDDPSAPARPASRPA